MLCTKFRCYSVVSSEYGVAAPRNQTVVGIILEATVGCRGYVTCCIVVEVLGRNNRVITELLDSPCSNSAEMVLSSIFRKFDSEKMKLCAGKSGEGAAKPRLIAAEHMPAAVSGAAKPFILTLDSAGGICYLIAALMPLLLRLRSDISYIDTAWFPTPFPKHTAVWHRPA